MPPKVSRRYIPTIVRWIFAIAWMALIFMLSSDPHSSERTGALFGDLNLLIRKCAHMTEYAILFCLFRFALTPIPSAGADLGKPHSAPRFTIINTAAFVMVVLYAGSDEWHQSFIPGRTSSIMDVGVDSCGASIALIVAILSPRRSKSCDDGQIPG